MGSAVILNFQPRHRGMKDFPNYPAIAPRCHDDLAGEGRVIDTINRHTDPLGIKRINVKTLDVAHYHDTACSEINPEG